MENQKICKIHQKSLTIMCLAQDCKEQFFLCDQCKTSNTHKHSKTDLVEIKQIRQKLKLAWQPKQSLIQPYFKKISQFYDILRKDVSKLIDQDQQAVQNYLTKVKYHHLPIQANSQVYLQFLKQQYQLLDKSSILKLINQVESAQLNKNLQKQKQITQFMDSQLKKVNDKIMTLKYVLLSKKLQTQLLIPKLPQVSKVCDQGDFIKIYSLFNARKHLIRSIKLIYRASQSKFSSKDFYMRCHGVHNCLMIVKTRNKKIVGGYSPLPLIHHDPQTLKDNQVYYEPDRSKRSFIFSVNKIRSYSLKDFSKAIIYKKNMIGPSFGVDLSIDKYVTSSMGNSYEGMDGIAVDSIQSKIMLLESDKVQLQEMEIWQMSF